MLFTTVAIQFLVGGQAFAQAPAPADTASDMNNIIVTARRIEERLQDVPISVSVVNQDRLTKANVDSAEDLIRVVPGLNVQSRYSSEQSSFSIRGFSQELRTSASVGTYFGEVVAPRGGGISLQGGDGAGPGNLFDLQNVQVLKGPQGTLFGRNTTGGAVVLTPRKPTSRFEGYVEGSYGNYDMKRVQAVVNAPLTSWARVRVGIDRQKRDGYQHNASGIGPRDFSNTNYIALRGSLVLDLASNLENYTIISYLRSHNNGQIAQLFVGNPAVPGFGTGAVDQAARYNASGDPYRIEQKLINPRSYTKQFQAINTTTWFATDTLTVKNIMSYSTFIQDLRQDIFGTNFDATKFGAPATPAAYVSTAFSFNPDGFHTNDQKNFTEELQLQGNTLGGKLNYQGGLYFEHSTPGGLTASTSPTVSAICLVSGFTTLADSRCLSRNPARPSAATPNTGTIEFINMAAYAQATYAITDQLKLTGGIRYTYDRSRGSAQGFTYIYPATGQYVAPVLAATATNPAGCSTGYPVATNCVFSARTSDKKPTWTVNLAYNPMQDMMVYATYSRGYRQGSVTPFAPAGSPVFKPEKVDSYELGAKMAFQGSVSGTFNVAGFYSNLTNQQLQVGLQDTTGVNPSATSIFNVGKSRIYGAEFDGSVRFGSLFRVDASGTYLNTKLQTITLPAFPGYNVVNPTALQGDPLGYSPKWGANIGGTLTLPVPKSIGKIEFGATYRYNSSYTSNASTVSSSKSTPVKQVDLNLDWRDVGGKPIDLALFGTNMTNQFTQGAILGVFKTFGFESRYVGRPRMYGVRAKIRFSEGK
jgi:iron complex outermembrane receptor protein